MPGDDFKKVRGGDPLAIPARTYNVLMDVAAAFKRRNPTGGGPEGGGEDPAVVIVQNMTGSNVARFGVLGLDTPCFDPNSVPDRFRDLVAFNGVVPNGTNHLGKFAIALEPLASNRAGAAVLVGAVQVQISVQDTAHTLADIMDGSTTQLITSTTGSAIILWKESGVGAGKWAIVKLGGPNLPRPQYAGDVLQGVAQNQIGYAPVRAQPMQP